MVPEESSPDWLNQQVPWRSSQPATPTSTNRLVVGDLVVYDQRPSMIAVIDPDGVPFTRWPAQFQTRWKMSGQPPELPPERWVHRPWRLTLEVVGKPWPPTSVRDNGKFRNVAASPSAYWAVLPTHFVVCRICAELPPCDHERRQRLLRRQQEELRNVLDLTPDSCLGCGHTITARQRTIRFAGRNLVRPDFGEDSAVFHQRRACREAVQDYDRKLASTIGSVPRFNCGGELTIHHNDQMECSRSDRCIGFEHAHAVYVPHRPTFGRTNFDDCWCMRPLRTEEPS